MASFIFRPFQVTIKYLNRGLKLFKHERKVFEKSPLLHSLEIYEEQNARFPLTAADLACCAKYCHKVVNLHLHFISNLDFEMITKLSMVSTADGIEYRWTRTAGWQWHLTPMWSYGINCTGFVTMWPAGRRVTGHHLIGLKALNLLRVVANTKWDSDQRWSGDTV